MSSLTQKAAQRKRQSILSAPTPPDSPQTPTQHWSPFRENSQQPVLKRAKRMMTDEFLYEPMYSDGYRGVNQTPEWRRDQPPTPRPHFSPVKIKPTKFQAHYSEPKPTAAKASSSNSGDSIKTTNSANLLNLRALKNKLVKIAHDEQYPLDKRAEKQRALVATLVRHGLLYYTGRKSNKQLRIAAVWMQNAHNYLDPATNTHPLDIMIERIKQNDTNITLNVSPKQLNTVQMDALFMAQITDAWANSMANKIRRSTFNPAKSN